MPPLPPVTSARITTPRGPAAQDLDIAHPHFEAVDHVSLLAHQPLGFDDEVALEIIEPGSAATYFPQARQVSQSRPLPDVAGQYPVYRHGLGGIFDAAQGRKSFIHPQGIVPIPVGAARAPDAGRIPGEHAVEQMHRSRMRDHSGDGLAGYQHGLTLTRRRVSARKSSTTSLWVSRASASSRGSALAAGMPSLNSSRAESDMRAGFSSPGRSSNSNVAEVRPVASGVSTNAAPRVARSGRAECS